MPAERKPRIHGLAQLPFISLAGHSPTFSRLVQVLAAITAKAFQEFSEAIEAGSKPKDVARQALQKHWRVIFNGNGYEPANQVGVLPRRYRCHCECRGAASVMACPCFFRPLSPRQAYVASILGSRLCGGTPLKRTLNFLVTSRRVQWDVCIYVYTLYTCLVNFTVASRFFPQKSVLRVRSLPCVTTLDLLKSKPSAVSALEVFAFLCGSNRRASYHALLQ
jgi:hypothetical protein